MPSTTSIDTSTQPASEELPGSHDSPSPRSHGEATTDAQLAVTPVPMQLTSEEAEHASFPGSDGTDLPGSENLFGEEPPDNPGRGDHAAVDDTKPTRALEESSKAQDRKRQSLEQAATKVLTREANGTRRTANPDREQSILLEIHEHRQRRHSVT
jgi:hypothetical protein